jgi:hypothetical protein
VEGESMKWRAIHVMTPPQINGPLRCTSTNQSEREGESKTAYNITTDFSEYIHTT